MNLINKHCALLPATLLASSLVLASNSAVRTVAADAAHEPFLPDSRDRYTINYKATNADAVEGLARLVRSFTAPTSNIFPNGITGTLQVTDDAATLKLALESGPAFAPP